MRRIQRCTTGSLFLMTLSAAAEAWFASKTSHGLYLSSHELLRTLFPTAIQHVDVLGNEYFPIFWALITSTILLLPLWSIFAIFSLYFSYLLMTDSSELKRYGKDFENLEMWSRLAHQDSALYLDRDQIDDTSLKDESIDTVTDKLEFSASNLLLDHEADEVEDLKKIIDNSISTIIAADDEEYDENRPQRELKSAHVDPEIWEPIPFIDNDTLNRLDNQTAYKDEIDEFDEFCEFLTNTETEFDEEEFYKIELLEKINKK